MGKRTVKTADLADYTKCTIRDLETRIDTLERQLPTPDVRQRIRSLRVAIAQRKKIVKAKVMDFEETNDHHLLLYDSTDGFRKIAGNSVLFYSLKIVDRIGRRCKVVEDKDSYSKSEDGIISVKSFETLDEKLAMLDILPDEELSKEELHFYKLPRVYTDEQIEKMRDLSRQELEGIQEIILPKSPLPQLYRDILELNRMIYYGTRNMSDKFAKDILGAPLLKKADGVLQSYLNYANVRRQTTWARFEVQGNVAMAEGKVRAKIERAEAQNLMNLLISIIQLKNRMSNVDNLKLMHHKQMGQILAKIVTIEQVAEREYGKLIREEKARREGKLQGG